jgi:hypothetical protein
VYAGVESLALLVAMRFLTALVAGVVFFRVVESRYLRPAKVIEAEAPEALGMPATR